MKEAVIFDLDGTLLNTLADLQAATNAALALRGLPTRTIEEVRNFVGNGIRNLIKRAMPEGSTDEEIDSALADFKAYYADHLHDRTTPYDGIPELIAELKGRGIRLAVLSNKVDSASRTLAQHFFPDTFDEIFGERTGIPRKPDPTSCRLVMDALGVSAQETLYVGDSGVDMQTAKNASLYAVGVTWGFRTREILTENGADALVDEPKAILNYIR